MKRKAETRTLQWSLERGYLVMTFPAELSPVEVDDIEEVIRLTVASMRRSAQDLTRDAVAADFGLDTPSLQLIDGGLVG